MMKDVLNRIELCITYGESFDHDLLVLTEQLTVSPSTISKSDLNAGDLSDDNTRNDINVLQFLISCVRNGQYEDVLRSKSFRQIVSCGELTEISTSDEILKAIAKYLEDSSGREYIRQLHVLLSGISSLQLFVKYNWTGPRRDNLDSLSDVIQLFCGDSKSILNLLTLEGEAIYHKVVFPELLHLSRLFLLDAKDRLNLCISYNIWRLRYLLIYQQTIPNITSTSYSMLKSVVEDISCLNFIKEQNQNRLANICFNVEAGIGFLYYSDVSRAKLYLTTAQRLAGIDINLTGALGKRTHFQQSAVAQLILKVLRCNKDTVDRSDFKEIICEEFPEDVQLRDDTVMNKVKFLNEDDQVISKLHPEEQIIILGLTYLVQKSSASQDLVTEELFAFINSLISDPKVWCLQFKLLALRCHLEKRSSRRVERAMMQVQALLDAVGKDSPDVSKRHFLFYCVQPPPCWVLEKELAYLLLSLGCTKAALEIFTRLELWEDVVICYQRLQRRDKAEAVVRKQLEIEETPTLWCLLGDCTDDSQFYLKAWELSGHRSARAQQSLGYLYFTKKQYNECIPFFQKSLEINSLQLKVWFSLAYAALEIENYELAAKSYRTIVSIDPDSFDAWNNLSTAYIKMKQKHRAWKTLQEALKCNYEEWKIWENYLVVCVDIGAFEDALNAYHRLMDIKGKFLDEEVLRILARAVCEDIVDINSQPASHLRGKMSQLFGRITSCIPNSCEVWKLYASILATDPEVNNNQNLLERIVQYLLKAHHCATQVQKWENNLVTCKEVVKNAEKLTETCLNYSHLPSVSGSSLQQMLNSVKLIIRNLIITLRKQLSYSLPDQTEELTSFVEVLENLLKTIMSLLEASP